MSGDEAAFIRANTILGQPPLVPELCLYLASEITPVWLASEAFLRANAMAPPFWAFAWPGGQALARYILDNPGQVAGRRVLDFAAGCGIAALAAARAGAACVQAADIDPLAIASVALNAAANGVSVAGVCADLVGAAGQWDIVMCGDVCYEAPMTRHILPWLLGLAAAGATVWLADPGRAYLPRNSLVEIACYVVPTSLELEDREVRHTVLYQLNEKTG